MLVRRATKADVPSLCRLQREWLEEGSVYGFVPESQEQVEAALDSYLVAEVGGRVVGFISGSVHESEGTAVIPEGRRYLEVENLFVLPEFRSQGVGSGLIARRLAQAQEEGVSYALVYSAAKDIRGVLRFYERHGFQSWYVQMFQKL